MKKKIETTIIQIFGKNDCNMTKKAIRYFKERKINIQYNDLAKKNISKRELENILNFYTLEELLDIKSKTYIKRNLEYMVFNIKEILLEDSTLLITPILRFDKKVFLGFDIEKYENLKTGI